MILYEVRDYMRIHKRAALADVARHFAADPGAVRGMLDRWVVKGKLEKLSVDSYCTGGCTKCDPSAIEIYAWKENE